jgi:PAS domain S-box-containing protein
MLLAGQEREPLKLGVLAYRPKPQVMTQWQPVADYLQTSLGRPVELAVYDHAEISVAVEQRAVDMVITTANQFIPLQHSYGLSSPLATLILHEGPYHLNAYGSVILARADRGDISALEDLVDKRIALVSLEAFAGYQMPALELLEAGVPLPTGDRLLVTGQPHDRVIDAVLEGRADAGFVRAGVLESLAREGKLDPARLKVINRQELSHFPYAVSTRLYPEWPVAVMPHIDREFASRLAATLYLMPPETLADSSLNLHGFGIPANYDVVENLLRRLRLPPFERVPEVTLLDLWHHYAWWIVTLASLLLLLAAVSAGLIAMFRRSRTSFQELQQMAEKEKLILSSLAEGVYGIDPQGRCIFINPRALNILGLTEKEVIGQDTHALFHAHKEDDSLNPSESCPVILAVRDGEKRELEDLFIHKDGRKIPVWMGISVMRHGQEIIGAVVAFQDITERKQAEEALRNSEQQMTRFLSNVEGFLFTFLGTPDGHFCFPYASPGIEKYYGLKPEDVREDMAPLHMMAHPQDRPLIEAAITESAKTMSPFRAEFRVCRSDAPERWIEARSIPQKNPDGNILWNGIMLDITERKQAEEALRKSEAEHRQIVATAKEGIWVLDSDTATTSVNARMAEMLGYAVEEVIGRPMDDFMFEEDVPDHRRKMEARRSGVSESYERRFRRKDGQVLWTVGSATPIFNEEQRFNGSFAMFTDITERKRNEAVNAARLHLIQFSLTHSLAELLEETLNQAETLTGSLIGFYHFVDDDQENLTLQAWSSRTKAKFCKAEGEGMHYPIADAGVWVDCMYERKAVIHNDYVSLPHRKGMPEGHADVVRELVTPVFRGDKISAILGVGNKPEVYTETDIETVSLLADLAWEIAERKRIEDELDRYHQHLEDTVQERTAELRLARDAAEAANKAKSVFLANMSHELRTPLNAVLGFSQLMRQDPGLSTGQCESLDIINNSGKHLLRLINDVLEIAKIEAGKLQLEISTFDLHELVREVSDMMRLRAEQRGLRLELAQSSDFPRYIKGDEARMRQILVNLVSNAVKFTVEGGVTFRLAVKDNAQHHLLIEVEDSGPGISKDDQQRLFRPFEQLPSGEIQDGTGLGLAIVHQFVQLMGGGISVESTLGKGSLFRVELPLEEAAEEEVVRLGDLRRGEVTGLAPGQPVYRILIAEDQRDNQLLLTKLMTELGLESRVAKNGEECIRIFEEWRPNLIWMDRRMPVMDGEEATRRIRKLPGGDQVKIVAVTASAFREEHKRMIAAGMDDVVRKPYRFHEIYDSLAQQLGLKFTYRERVQAEETLSTILTPDMLSGLEDELQTELHEALDALDGKRIATVIRRIGKQDAELARLLTSFADNYNYPEILAALKQVEQKNG